MGKTFLSLSLLVVALTACKKPEPPPEAAPAPAPQSAASVEAAAPAPPPPPPTADAPAAPTDGPAPTPSEAAVNVTYLNQAIADFFSAEMRAPRDLNELVKGGYAKSLPTPPPGKKFVIDPKTRQVSIVNK